MSLPTHPDVKIVSEQTVWSGRFRVDVVQFRHRRFDGTMSGLRTWELFRRGRAAAVLPYDPVRDRVALIEQFRLPALAAGMAPVMVEIPAGLCDADEDPATTAQREVGEESGLTIGAMHEVGQFLLTPGGSDEQCTLFMGHADLPDGPATSTGLASEQEDIQLLLMDAGEAIEQAVAGAYPNSVTTIALLWLAARRDWLRREWA